MVNKKRLIKLTRDLIRIDSQNPGADEFKIARFIKGYLNKIKVRSKIYEFKKNRSNIIAVLPGKDKKRSLLITPHLDTVPRGLNWHFNPFGGQTHKGRIYGLGATDCKCNIAASLEALNSIVEDKAVLGYNLVLAVTADEECGSELGIIPLLKKGILNPDAAVVLDADDFDIIVSQKGLIHLKVKIYGKRAHGAYPWMGNNAIGIAVDILKELKNKKFVFPKNKHLRPPTLNIGTIKGGDKVNIVADWCEIELDFRFLPGMSEKAILKDLDIIVRKYARRYKIEIQGIQKPYEIEQSHSLVKSIVRSMAELNIKPKVKGSEGATTATFFKGKNIPAIATGFGSSGCAHAPDEYVKINGLYKGALALEGFLKTYTFNYKE